MRQLAKLAVSPERENRLYREPNVPAIIALLESVNKRDTAHKLFLPLPVESDEQKALRIQEGAKQAAALLSMFDESPKEPELTYAERQDLAKLEKIRSGL